MKVKLSLIFLLMLLGNLCFARYRGKADSLRNELLKAIANKKKDNDTSKINDLNKLADAYQASYPDSSVYYGDLAVHISRKIKYNKGIADGLALSAKIYITQGKYQLVLVNLKQSDSLYRAGNDLRGLSTCDKIYGDLYCQNSDYKKALFYYKRSLSAKLKLKELPGISRLYLDLGNVYNGMGAYSMGIDYYFKSLNIDTRLHNKSAIADDYNDIGYLLQNMNIYPKALTYYYKGLALYTQVHSSIGIAIIKQNIGEVFLAQGKYDDAIKYVNAALVIYLQQDNKDGICQLYGDLGLCALYKKGNTAALSYLQQSLTTAAVNHLDADRAMALTNIALYYNRNLDYKRAYGYALQAKSWADHINSVLLRTAAYIQWIKALGGLQMYKEAFIAQQAFDQMTLSAHKDESVQKFTLYNTEYNYANKEKQQLLQRKADALLYRQKIRDQRLLNIIFFIITAAMVFIIALYYRQKHKQMKINAKLSEKNQEVSQQKVDLDVQAEELNELNKLKDRLISILAHDLRSPLSTLRGLFKLLEDDTISHEELLVMIPGVVSKLDYTSDFLDTLLFWINSQMENYHSATKKFSVNEVIDLEYANCKEQAALKGITLTVRVTEQLTAVADPNSVRIVIRNLVTNAVKFSSDGDCITISATKLDAAILVSISDTGTGMTTEQQNKLFKNRVDSATGTGNESGTGMGLLFCKDLVEKCSGKIWVESQQGSGTAFYFTIPMEDAELPELQLD
ncbi:tetratricopeptide repeat-containing sensor histidine kinase [Mucilaginibacter sp. BJC16-A38]|uniref:tetratricopeptide repeat-containing sensor histidine kinase n=1 Tax=Mucilaginibacter phenanthrenivorans TaxID=1234842 RepID=UPI0021583D22|nr:tetratricopeptide repeat-containing sensor histidine kinase [Mucilaginibacter phenanthrenivorans]MCR8560131.1 tetratricopeptide repeat-containing sensor histidine kinase [Mucilaginibacter phenanthrenivorans]